MIKPKSRAPRLIRFPETPKIDINVIAINMAIGITEATMSPALKFPSKSTSTKITIVAPSNKFVETVETARFTRLVRSRKYSTFTPSGKVLSISFIFSFTKAITSEELDPFNINAIPPTASPLSSIVKAPYRTKEPN